MPDIERIVSLYELYKSYKRVAKELRISRNTVRKYVHRVDNVHQGKTEKILPKDRNIQRTRHILTDTIREKIHLYLESNLQNRKKQRITAKRIWELLIKNGELIGYTTVKEEVAWWKEHHTLRQLKK